MEFLANINKEINESGKKKGDIARALGISYNHLWRILTGNRKMKADFIVNLSIAIGKTPNELYGYHTNDLNSFQSLSKKSKRVARVIKMAKTDSKA